MSNEIQRKLKEAVVTQLKVPPEYLLSHNVNSRDKYWELSKFGGLQRKTMGDIHLTGLELKKGKKGKEFFRLGAWSNTARP
jgi:hypothetical protein